MGHSQALTRAALIGAIRRRIYATYGRINHAAIQLGYDERELRRVLAPNARSKGASINMSLAQPIALLNRMGYIVHFTVEKKHVMVDSGSSVGSADRERIPSSMAACTVR